MHPARRDFLLVNLVGGVAVLGSYALWLGHRPEEAGLLWGAIGGAGRTVYTSSMLLAAAGYFAFTVPLLVADPERTGLGGLQATLALILLPSALWMPLAFEFLRFPSAVSWWAMRAVLGVVGIASLALVAGIARRREVLPAGRLALAGSVAFAFQTAVLDALVWPRWFAP